jgi:hypothetical protein
VTHDAGGDVYRGAAEAEEASHDSSPAHQLASHPDGRIARDGKANALRDGDDGGVDADHPPLRIDQRAPRIARVEGSIGLHDAVHEAAVFGSKVATEGADDAGRDGALEP